jgi:hypothetical protein
MEQNEKAFFDAHAALWAWLHRLALLMRAQALKAGGEEAAIALAAARRLDPGR